MTICEHGPAHVPLEIADDKQYTNILPRFPGPSEHSGPRGYFAPSPCPPSRRPWFILVLCLHYNFKKYRFYTGLSRAYLHVVFACIFITLNKSI
jgi:hypothetical protein